MKSILIIDDDALIRKTLISHLNRRGCETRAVEDGESGLEAFFAGNPDLVLLDVRLPDLDGLEVLRRIRDKSPRAVVVVMTAFDDMKTTVEAVKGGAFEYLVKPLDFVALDLTIDKAFKVKALEEKIDYLVSEKQKEYLIDNIIGSSPGMRDVFKLIGSVAGTRANVLIRAKAEQAGTGGQGDPLQQPLAGGTLHRHQLSAIRIRSSKASSSGVKGPSPRSDRNQGKLEIAGENAVFGRNRRCIVNLQSAPRLM